MVISATVALAILDLEIANTKGQAIKNSTKKNLLSQLNAYIKFCDRYMLTYFPCDNIQLCRFGQHLKRTFQSPDAVGNYISGIRTCLALLGMVVPDSQDKQMQMFNQGLKRIMPHAVKQAAPITPEILVKMSKVVNYQDTVEMIAWTATLLGFYMFLRKSNLVPDNMQGFNIQQQFARQDINITGLQDPIMAEIRWSKTIQFKQRVLRCPVLPAGNKSICPVYWTHHMITHVKAGPTEPLFAIPSKDGWLSLSANQLVARIRKWLKLIKEDEEAYSLHSLRRGGATFAYRSNLEADMIKTLGDWSSDAFKRYIDVSMDQRYTSMRKFVDALNRLTVEAYI